MEKEGTSHWIRWTHTHTHTHRWPWNEALLP